MSKPPTPHTELLTVFAREKVPDTVAEHRDAFLAMLFTRLYTPFLHRQLAVSPVFDHAAFEHGKREYVATSASVGFEIVHDSMAGLAGRHKKRTDEEVIDHVVSLTQKLNEIETVHRWRIQNEWLQSFDVPPYLPYSPNPDDTATFSSEGYLPDTMYDRMASRIDTCPSGKRTPAFLGTVAFEGIKNATIFQLAAEEAWLKTSFHTVQQRSAA